MRALSPLFQAFIHIFPINSFKKDIVGISEFHRSSNPNIFNKDLTLAKPLSLFPTTTKGL